ncbi:MAG: HPr kinase/phosphatase C-terminal domain-containing protein [Alphaproteobacteria bacterium]|nr:HPr kinase/phosphatase C-terminal domain-containing protein [Alphaproteobacteria bacterium]
MQTVYGTTVAVDGDGVLLRGPSASGKSDLALRLIDAGAALVADDRTVVARDRDAVVASSPAALAGKMEVRGLGIVTLPAVPAAPLKLVVDLDASDAVERLPPAASTCLLGVDIPVMRLAAFEGSAPAKIRLALRLEPQEIER